MDLRRLLVLAALPVLLAGCGGSTPAPAPTSSSPSSSPAPTLATGAEVELLQKLRSIEPLLVADQDRTLSRARNICMKAREADATHSQLVAYTRAEYEGGAVPIVTPAQAELILLSITDTICP